MAHNYTGSEMAALINGLTPSFSQVKLEESTEQLPDGLSTEYPSRLTGTDCIIRVPVQVDGAPMLLMMRGPLANSSMVQDPRASREQELYEDDATRDFLTGMRNRRFWETIFCPNMLNATAEGTPASFAMVKIDDLGDVIRDHGQPVADQIIGYVANLWARAFEEDPSAVICRLSGHSYAIGCIGTSGIELKKKLTEAYAHMNLTCTCTVGMLRRVPFTLSIAVADAAESAEGSWPELYVLCDKRLRAAHAAGGNRIYSE